jgi:hypothetical protein
LIAALSTNSSSWGSSSSSRPGNSKELAMQHVPLPGGSGSKRGGVVGVPPAAVQAAAPALHLAFVVLENSTFTCPDNIDFLVKVQLMSNPGSTGQPHNRSGSGTASINGSSSLDNNHNSSIGGSSDCSFPQLLVAIARALLGGALGNTSPSLCSKTSSSTTSSSSISSCRSCLHAACSVLMNLSHQGDEAAAAVAGAGGLALAVEVLQQSLGQAGQDSHRLWRQVGFCQGGKRVCVIPRKLSRSLCY